VSLSSSVTWPILSKGDRRRVDQGNPDTDELVGRSNRLAHPLSEPRGGLGPTDEFVDQDTAGYYRGEEAAEHGVDFTPHRLVPEHVGHGYAYHTREDVENYGTSWPGFDWPSYFTSQS
jgi:hypothetical protein